MPDFPVVRSSVSAMLLAALLLAARLGHAQAPTYRCDPHAVKLDLCADRSRLGAVHRGFNNGLVSANFFQPLALELH